MSLNILCWFAHKWEHVESNKVEVVHSEDFSYPTTIHIDQCRRCGKKTGYYRHILGGIAEVNVIDEEVPA